MVILFTAKESSSDVYGFNANYQINDPMSTVVEAYMFSRFNGDNNGFDQVTGANTAGGRYLAGHKGNTLYVPGLRASTNPIKGLNVQGEVAWQLGNHPVFNTPINGTTYRKIERRDAMAAQFLASYALPVLDKYKPTVNASFTYVSGDKNGGS